MQNHLVDGASDSQIAVRASNGLNHALNIAEVVV